MLCAECKARPDNNDDVVCKANIRRLIMTRHGGELGCLNDEKKIAHRMLDLLREGKPFITAYIMFCFGLCAAELAAIAEIKVADLFKIADEYAEAYIEGSVASVYDAAFVREEFDPRVLDFDKISDFVDQRLQRDKRFNPTRIVTMECSQCGHDFLVRYNPDGTYDYKESPCDCEADFYPAEGEPSISEWLATLF